MKFFAIIAALVAVAAAAPVETTWSLQQIDAALQDPSTNPALIPYLEHALNMFMEALHSGHQIETIAIPLPADIAVIPEPVPAPIDIVPTPVIVEEEAAPAPAQAASSPLVQIIVNVQQQEQAAPVPSPIPSPAIVPEIIPTPVIVIDEPFESIDVSPAEVDIVPEPVIVDPIDVNPIDVIAVGAIENNPVDIANPIPVNPAGEAGILV